MKIAIHQPNYLPYLGFFDKMKKSDVFVIYDDAQFNKEDFQHRNRIKIFNGSKWLTVPVEKKMIPINEIRIKNESTTWKGLPWNNAHLNDIRDNYQNTSFFNTYEKEIVKIYTKKYNKLVDLNMSLINFLRKAFDIDTKVVLSSSLGFSSRSSERLLEIVEALGGTVYLSGYAGVNYLDISLFESKNIRVEFKNFVHPIYKQNYENFIPNMAAIDALLNVGKMPEIGAE